MKISKTICGGIIFSAIFFITTGLALQTFTPNGSIDTGIGYGLGALIIGFIAGIYVTKNYLNRRALKKI